MKKIFLILFTLNVFSQNIDVNNSFFYNEIIRNDIDSLTSFTILPIDISKLNLENSLYFNSGIKNITSKNKKFRLSFFPIENTSEYNTNIPFKSNNGIMLPNVGLQNVLSTGFNFKLKNFSFQIKPEFHYMDNNFFEEFYENHFPIIWERRYRLWNNIDMPVRFGNKPRRTLSIGQSNLFFDINNIRIGYSTENQWWGPSRKNSIMMSNNSRGFGHYTIQTSKPINTSFGKIEFKYMIGKLKSSGFLPPNIDGKSSGTKYYIPKDLRANYQDFSSLNAFIFTFSPEHIKGLSFGIIRWLQSYYEKNNIFNTNSIKKIFEFNFLKNIDTKQNKASGLFLKFKEDKFEIYGELYRNSPSNKYTLNQSLNPNLKKVAHTLGIHKTFNNNLLLNWEWTRMEQKSEILTYNLGSWYEHNYLVNGFTNFGEVIGSKIGPGSNSHSLTLKKIFNKKFIGLGLEIIENDNDFYHISFSDSGDYRRYWKDFTFKFFYFKEFSNFNLSLISNYTRSLNYNWGLDRTIEPWYHAGTDKNNFNIKIKFHYFL